MRNAELWCGNAECGECDAECGNNGRNGMDAGIEERDDADMRMEIWAECGCWRCGHERELNDGGWK